LDSRQRNAFVIQPFQPKDKPKAKYRVFEIRFRGSVVLLLQQIQVILDLIVLEFSRQRVEMQGHLRQMPGVIVERALTPAGCFHATLQALE
jgi:hypothetical protein